ncbi:MAG: acyl-CoA thioesterase [Kiritimatiellae bacterium]|nr:acyl-CoA thioesterase [Kiritimatiellia bacterium]MCO5067443.1 acyl-CoA thioesterase [Kiritimatiellia bacterium]
MFTYTTTIRLHDTDAAGVIYFATQFRLAHEAYEAFMAESGTSLSALLKKGSFALPIVHAEANYSSPLRLGDTVTIKLRLQRLGKTSFTLVSRFSANGKPTGYVTTTHVAVSRSTGHKLLLPAALKKIVQRLRTSAA